MDHSEIMELLPAYVDQELGIAETLAIQRHLETCADCRREVEEQTALSKRIRTETAYFNAPADLANRIAGALPPNNARNKRLPGRWHTGWSFNWLQTGGVLATLLAVMWSAGLYLSLPSAQERMTDEIVASHVRSLQANHLTDVASTDQHTVKPWFNGRLSFSPPVIDLAAQGFTLEGGRLDYIDGHPVAALIYRRHQHPINLYIWPAGGKDAGPQAETSRGYHLVRWTSDEMYYWAVSDVA